MIYKLLIRAIFMIALINPSTTIAQCNDFITVDGKKLKCGQNDFFALTMNYMTEIMHGCGTTSAQPYTIQNNYPTRAHMYCADNQFAPEILNKAQAYNAMLKDFTDIKAQGFNTVRVTGAGYKDIESKDCTAGNSYFISYTDPLFHQLLLDIQAEILKAASQAGLKVVMLLGEVNHVAPYVWYKKGIAQPAPPISKTDGFTNYLKLFSSKFKDDPTLLAVDFLNEPDLLSQENKTTICALTKKWNDVVKSQSNILTTVGLWSISSLYWDGNMMNIDFVSYHNYPEIRDTINVSDLSLSIDRIKSDYYWAKNNIHIPWMVGETTFEAHPNNVTHPINAGGRWNRTTFGGTLQDQANYLAATLDACRDYGGVGYSWWSFMDEHVSKNFSTPYSTPSDGPFFGLAYANEGNTTTIWKPAANYIPVFNPSPSSSPGQPANYYNYYNTPYTGKYATGIIKTINNMPIKDALVEIHDTNGKIYFTYTDVNGYYTINSLADIELIKIMATECSNYAEAFTPSPIVTRNIFLTKVDRSVTSSLSYANQNVSAVSINDHANTYATFSNYQINASDFHVTAFDYIRLNPGTAIYPGNDFSATIGNYYHNCGSFAFRKNNSEQTSSEVTFKEHSEDMPLHHELNSIFPNPGTGNYQLSMAKEGDYQVEVYNMQGAKVRSERFTGTSYNVDLQNEANGIYLFTIKNKTELLEMVKIVKE